MTVQSTTDLVRCLRDAYAAVKDVPCEMGEEHCAWVKRGWCRTHPAWALALLPEAADRIDALEKAIRRIDRTKVYEVGGQPCTGISVEMIGALREARELAGGVSRSANSQDQHKEKPSA